MSLIRDTSVCMTLTLASGAFADADAGVGLDPKITKALLHRRLPTNARHKDRTRSSMKIKKRNEIMAAPGFARASLHVSAHQYNWRQYYAFHSLWHEK
ncbi:hypothetical protein AcV7_004118 [Taiwanofungus camphoratus]|nr:hypothetical protein AcV7_004118 [Antrodia cinnamomea]